MSAKSPIYPPNDPDDAIAGYPLLRILGGSWVIREQHFKAMQPIQMRLKRAIL